MTFPDYASVRVEQADTALIGRIAIDDAVLVRDPRRGAHEVIVRRAYEKVAERLDDTARLPEWAAFASARQGLD